MVFIKCTTFEGKEEFFCGDTMEDFLRDTDNGRGFGGVAYKNFEKTSEQQIKLLRLEFLQLGVESVLRGTSKNYFVGAQRLAS